MNEINSSSIISEEIECLSK